MPLGPFSFEAPVWLWLAAIGVPVALLAVRLLASMTGLRRWTAAVARAALFALIAVTLAGAASVRETDRLAVVAVVDVSGSVLRYGPQVVDEQGRREAIVDRVRGWLARSTRGRGPDDLLGIVVFDGQALAVAAPTAGDPLDRPFEAAGAEGSDLGAALRLARALIPADAAGRIVLISDGNQTAGDAIGAAREASSPRGQRGPTPIDVAPIEYRLTREVFVESVDAPASAGAEATITLRVALVATSPSRGVLRVLQDGQSVDATPERDGDALPIELAAGRTVVAVPVALSPARTHRFEVIFEPAREDSGEGAVPGGEVRLVGDTDVANNRGEAFTVTPGRGSILILDGDGQGNPGGPGATLANVWREAGIEAELAAPDAMPGDLLSLQRYDMVVLQNVPADALGPERMELLSAYVRDLGGGLLTLGGRESYGAGGWKGSALEELLPVSLDLPERLLSPDLAVVFVMDRSGSMGWRVQGSTRSKQEITSEAAAAAVRSLQATDLVGVVTYNLDHQVVVPLGPNTDPERTATSILGISPDGGTASGSALREAERQLLAVDAKTRHIILLSDGQSMDADILPDMARQMHERGITISTIAVGDGAHIESMRLVAFYGGGTFYEVVNPSVLPRVFLRAVRVLRTPMVRESAFRPLLGVGESPLVAGVSGVDEDGLPRLMGLNLTQARAETTAINALVTPDGEPVLAHWQVELGQVVSFTSDVWRWGAAWPEWGSFRMLWTQVARLASRPAAARGLDLGATIRGERLHVRLDATDAQGRPLDLLTIEAAVFAPDGSSRDATLEQVGPGVYEADVATQRSGAYVVVAKPRQGERALAPIVAGAIAPDAQEYRRLSSDESLMREIASAGGGRVLSLDDAAALFERSGVEPLRASTPLWPVLVAWTLGVLLLDVGTRRIAWDRLVSRELRGKTVLASMAEATRDRGGQAAGTLSRLAGLGAGLGAAREREASGAALSGRDAVETARRVEAQRQSQRVAAARAAMGAGAVAGTTPKGSDSAGSGGAESGAAGAKQPSGPVQPPADESPLQRAKRLARERLEKRQG